MDGDSGALALLTCCCCCAAGLASGERLACAGVDEEGAGRLLPVALFM